MNIRFKKEWHKERKTMAKTILVVDDEPDILKTVSVILKHAGFNVLTAVDGNDCLKRLEKNKADLILLDIMMPGTPSKEIVKRIKNTKIAFLTAVQMSEAEKEQLLSSKNIVGYIQKPFDLEELVTKVKYYLSGK